MAKDAMRRGPLPDQSTHRAIKRVFEALEAEIEGQAGIYAPLTPDIRVPHSNKS